MQAKPRAGGRCGPDAEALAALRLPCAPRNSQPAQNSLHSLRSLRSHKLRQSSAWSARVRARLRAAAVLGTAKGPPQPPALRFAPTAARAPRHQGRALPEQRRSAGARPHLRCRGAQQNRVAHRSRRCVERALFELEHRRVPLAHAGPQGCNGELCASPGSASTEESL